MNRQGRKAFAVALVVGMLAGLGFSQSVAFAQNDDTAATQTQLIDPGPEARYSDLVTINVKNANITEVLRAFSLQTGQSIVVGPDVVSDNVNVRINNRPWQEALDVILKPYGFGYRIVGDTIVVSRLESIITVEGIEPLNSKLFILKFVDAYDIKDICEAQLTERGKCTILVTKSMPGWEFGGDASGGSGAAVEGGVRKQREREDILKSKKIVVTDVPSAITRIEKIIHEIDALPKQVLIEAKFMEIISGDLTDIGLDYIGALERIEANAAGGGASSSASLVNDNLLNVLNLTTGFPNPLDTGATGSFSQDNGVRLTHSTLGNWGAEMLIALMAQNNNVNILSAPSILSIDNQEAAILVGKKYPIIESQNNSGSGSTVTSTSLDYYENIGIQLNVIPQVCADGYVNMIVHPAVSEIDSFESGVVTAGSDTQSGTQYPVLNVREAETQIMLQSSNTAIIGGLQSERDKKMVKKLPFLGDIPYLGRLFRRETVTKEKVDLLIFIKATIVENESYQNDSMKTLDRRKQLMNKSAEAAGSVEETVPAASDEGRELLEALEK